MKFTVSVSAILAAASACMVDGHYSCGCLPKDFYNKQREAYMMYYSIMHSHGVETETDKKWAPKSTSKYSYSEYIVGENPYLGRWKAEDQGKWLAPKDAARLSKNEQMKESLSWMEKKEEKKAPTFTDRMLKLREDPTYPFQMNGYPVGEAPYTKDSAHVQTWDGVSHQQQGSIAPGLDDIYGWGSDMGYGYEDPYVTSMEPYSGVTQYEYGWDDQYVDQGEPWQGQDLWGDNSYDYEAMDYGYGYEPEYGYEEPEYYEQDYGYEPMYKDVPYSGEVEYEYGYGDYDNIDGEPW